MKHKYEIDVIREEHEGLTVESYMKKILAYSGRKIQKLTRKKGIFLNGKTVYLQKQVKTGDVLRVISIEDKSYGVTPEPGVIDILYEDKEFIVLNKPANLLVHPTGYSSKGTLANHLAYYFKKADLLHTIRPLHRLDRETSGCIVFAKNSRTQSILEKQLKEGNLKRTYLALAKGYIMPAEGIINVPISIHPKLNNRRIVDFRGDLAITHYRRVDSLREASLVECTLETGRTHQIRVHLAYIGHPIIGDKMYGIRSSLISRQALHASKIRLIHPSTDQEINIQAPMPSDLKQAIDRYRN